MANLKAAQHDKDAVSGRESSQILQLDNSPLPPAEELERIHAIDPSLVEFVKNELATQYEFNRKTISERDSTVRTLNITGLWLGSTIALVAILSSTFLIYSGFVVGGSLMGLASLASVVTVIVNAGANQRRADHNLPDTQDLAKNRKK